MKSIYKIWWRENSFFIAQVLVKLLFCAGGLAVCCLIMLAW